MYEKNYEREAKEQPLTMIQNQSIAKTNKNSAVTFVECGGDKTMSKLLSSLTFTFIGHWAMGYEIEFLSMGFKRSVQNRHDDRRCRHGREKLLSSFLRCSAVRYKREVLRFNPADESAKSHFS